MASNDEMRDTLAQLKMHLTYVQGLQTANMAITIGLIKDLSRTGTISPAVRQLARDLLSRLADMDVLPKNLEALAGWLAQIPAEPDSQQ